MNKKIFAFDTETHKGKAFICSISNKKGESTIVLNNKNKAIDFFIDCCFKKFGNIGFAYNLDYDLLAIWKFFPKNFCEELYLKRKKKFCGVIFEYIPKKFLRISYYGKECYIFELMQYFPGGLDNAGKKFLGMQKLDIGGSTIKKNIYEAYRKNKQRIIKYCEADAKITYLLSEHLDKMVTKFGLNLDKYYSCGFIAKKYLDTNRVFYPKLQDEKILRFVKPAYFGGRIEFVQKGFFKKVYQYDINSAYPYACRDLEYITDMYFSKRISRSSTYYFVDCDVKINSTNLSAMAYRLNGLVVYPSGTIQKVVLDNFTFDLLNQQGSIIKINKVLNIFTNGQKPFYDMVTNLYNRRLKSDEDEKYIIKIILNSLYGKFAEKRKEYSEVDSESALLDIDTNLFRGGRIIDTNFGMFRKTESYGKNSNLIYSSLITAKIRKYLYDTIKDINPSDYLGAMTDCIFLKKPLTKNVSSDKQLGKFSLKEKSWLYVIGCGVYQSESGTKFRGYNTTHSLLNLAKKNKKKSNLTLPSTEKKGLGKLVVQGIDYSDLNVIFENEKNLNLNFDKKRIWKKQFKNFEESLKTNHTSTTLILNK